MSSIPAWKVRAAKGIMWVFVIAVVLFVGWLAVFLVRVGIEYPYLGLMLIGVIAITVFALLVGWAASVLEIEK